MSQTHYQTLEIGSAAEPEEIRKAYRLLARQLHPDLLADRLKKAGAEEFVKVQLAYEELSDPIRRAAYDKKLAAEAQRAEEARAAASAPAPKPKPSPPPEPEPRAEPVEKEEPAAPAGKREPFLNWEIGLSAALLIGAGTAGYLLAWHQVSTADSGWVRVFPISWMIITFLLILLALTEDGVLYSMFLTMGAIGVLTWLLGGETWFMLGIQAACTGSVVGAIKLLRELIPDRIYERAAMRA